MTTSVMSFNVSLTAFVVEALRDEDAVCYTEIDGNGNDYGNKTRPKTSN